MTHPNCRPGDHGAPFRDTIVAYNDLEAWEREVERVVDIGASDLLAWWERVKDCSSPATHGHTGSDFTSMVAFCLDKGETWDNCDLPEARAVNAALVKLRQQQAA